MENKRPELFVVFKALFAHASLAILTLPVVEGQRVHARLRSR